LDGNSSVGARPGGALPERALSERALPPGATPDSSAISELLAGAASLGEAGGFEAGLVGGFGLTDLIVMDPFAAR
jgi:hypothetical protein